MKQATQIDVGLHKHWVGFTVYYGEDEKQHLLFGKEIAKRLCEKLLKTIADLEYIERQMPTGDGIGISEGIGMRLTPPGGE